MLRRPPASTRTDPRVPSPTLFRSLATSLIVLSNGRVAAAGRTAEVMAQLKLSPRADRFDTEAPSAAAAGERAGLARPPALRTGQTDPITIDASVLARTAPINDQAQLPVSRIQVIGEHDPQHKHSNTQIGRAQRRERGVRII